MMGLAPIGIPTYNRIEHLTKTVNSLKKNDLAKDSELYIFSDAPKVGDEEEIYVVREYVLPSCFRAQGTASQVRFKYSPGATINATTVGSLVIVVDYNINFMGTK